jgi:ribosome-binding ATPase YchF (GTP1/OBG family)
LKQQTYFTAGVKEVRAWTIDVGSTAPQAAGVIHTDFEKDLFVPKLLLTKISSVRSEAKCKEAGKFKVEEKSMSLKMVM